MRTSAQLPVEASVASAGERVRPQMSLSIVAPARYGRLRDLELVGVDRDRNLRLTRQASDHELGPGDLLGSRDRLVARAGRLTSDVEHVRAPAHHPQPLRHPPPPAPPTPSPLKESGVTLMIPIT